MKICYLAPTFLPSQAANCVQVLKMCEALAHDGADVELLVPGSRPDDGVVEALWSDHALRSRFAIEWIPTTPVARGHDFATRAARRARFPRAGLVYSRHLAGAAWASSIGVPTVLEMHQPAGGTMGLPYLRRFLHGRGCRGLAVISAGLRDALLEEGLPRASIFVAPDGVDLAPFASLPPAPEARRLLGIDDRPTVGYCGHLYEGRGIRLMLELAAELPHAQFLVVGGTGQAVAQLLSDVRELGLDNVRVVGHVPHAMVPLHLAASDVLVMPYEVRVATSNGADTVSCMSPMKMFEYMASGRAVVSSDLPVLREVLDESTAVLCPPGDLPSWSRGVSSLLADDALRARMGASARASVEAFTWTSRALAVTQFAQEYGSGMEQCPRSRRY